jgi:F-type H+-transporting ATPase subunit b
MQINPDYTILIQFGQLMVLLIIFNFLLFKPILNALKKRQGTIDSLVGKTEDYRLEAEGMGKAYDEKLKEKKLPILEERDSLLKQTQAASMKVVEEARQELAGELAKVKDTVRREAEASLESLRAESDRLAKEVVAKIMTRGR